MNNSNDPADFIDRYQQNPNAIPDQEVSDLYQQAASQLSSTDYQQVAQQVFAQMSPQERIQFAQSLIQQAQQQGYSFPDINQDGIDDRLQDPNQLAQMTHQAHQQQPEVMNKMLNSDTQHSLTNALSSPVAKGVMGGIAAYGLSRLLGGGSRGGGLLDSAFGSGHSQSREHGGGLMGGILGNDNEHGSGHRHGGGHGH